MKHAREEQGFVLVAAIILLTVMMGLGLGLLMLTDNQQKASASEQASEVAFNVAESALNAQIGQLSREWPGVGTAGESLQRTCTPSTSTTTNYCPDPVSLEKAYPNTGSTSCPGTEAWGSPLTNKWDTYVREDLSGSPYFNSAAESAVTVNDYDGGIGNGTPTSPWKKLWVRAVGVVNCHAVTVVSLVSEQLVHANFPESALSANSFETGNNGSKVILNRTGKEASQAGKFTIRCEPPSSPSTCEEYRPGQIVPPLTEEEKKPSATPSTTYSAEQLKELKAQAKSIGHFYSGPGNCPGNKELEKLSGQPTYVEGCELKFTGEAANSPPAKPGFLILANGSIELAGGAVFYGVVYDANLQKSSEPLVTIKGGAKVVGAIVVDGSGGISLGDKGNEVVAFEYDPTVIREFEIFTGAAGTRNGFRILPAGQ